MTAAGETPQTAWLMRKLASYRFTPIETAAHQATTLLKEGRPTFPTSFAALFQNDFTVEDIAVFDDGTLSEIVAGRLGIACEEVARGLHRAPVSVVARITALLPPVERERFERTLAAPLSTNQEATARRRLLDALFWELTYWKTPDLYEELVEGERLHPGIFDQLAADLAGQVVVDIGAGSGRASWECIRHGATRVYAVEPSPGLLWILRRTATELGLAQDVLPVRGRFDRLPLPDNCAGVTISCSAFTADPNQGGDDGLAELLRVTRPGGKVVIIWPRAADYHWLAERGFQYEALPLHDDMTIRFRSLEAALRCARRFYAHKPDVLGYLLEHRRPEIPFAVLGYNPPHDYCWLTVAGERRARDGE